MFSHETSPPSVGSESSDSSSVGGSSLSSNSSILLGPGVSSGSLCLSSGSSCLLPSSPGFWMMSEVMHLSFVDSYSSKSPHSSSMTHVSFPPKISSNSSMMMSSPSSTMHSSSDSSHFSSIS